MGISTAALSRGHCRTQEVSSHVEIDPATPDPVRVRCRSVADVAERLMAKYERTLPLALISTTVCAAAHSVGRVTAPNVLAETIMWVSDHRLASIAAASS